MPTITIDNKALPSVRNAGNRRRKPDGFRDIDAVAAGEPNQNHLPHARQQSRGQENSEMPSWIGRRSGFKRCTGPGHAQCCTTRNSSISAAALARLQIR